MAENNQRVKIQHYVPQFLLRNFTDSEGMLHVCDKSNERVFHTGPSNVAAESGFYDFCVGQSRGTIEDILATQEATAAPLVHRLLEEENLSCLSEEDKVNLSIFITIQILRVKSIREMMNQALEALKDKIIQLGYDREQTEQALGIDPERMKLQAINGLMGLEDLFPLIHCRPWMLFRTSQDNPFLISDSPITRQNLLPGSGGNLGLAARGIEIYFPLSSTLTLGIFCESYREIMLTADDRMKELGLDSGELEHACQQMAPEFSAMLRALRDQTPVDLCEKRLANLNALQVAYSSRFLFSSKNDFSFVKKILSESPNLKTPMRIVT